MNLPSSPSSPSSPVPPLTPDRLLLLFIERLDNEISDLREDLGRYPDPVLLRAVADLVDARHEISDSTRANSLTTIGIVASILHEMFADGDLLSLPPAPQLLSFINNPIAGTDADV